MNSSIFGFPRLGFGERMWDNALLSMTSLVASIYVILFLFPCFSTIIYLVQTLSKKFDKSPIVPRNSCVSMFNYDSGPRTAPRAHPFP